ncbi:Antibiotic biosynthesis monooxygenase [Amycolatopsis xylanica]|uniref:Antibiotic biosynthesis monooxygenase n=1 Tax=Amycolatopsis xylanica TaxID=589385 RepID=A0A1H3SFB4_9PSEU|nr:antibiotic biosynthesis monooxygenase [Amycolatopsis xylanica]SDZ36594.1 Antibiotic biosynthesis monooxygenase [Amycolatopsis xylanica]
MTITRSSAMPRIARPDSRAVFLSHWFVGDAVTGRAVLDEIGDAWERTAWPEGILAFSAYLSADGDTVMTYTQCADDTAYRPFVRALPAAVARVEPVEYRLRRDVVLDSSAAAPGAIVIASFDVDGPERQETIVAAVAANLERSPSAERGGLIASHFHASLDGTRVINYAEWTTDEAHVLFLEGATRHGSLRITNDMPGVRPIGFKRYHLHHALARAEDVVVL